MTSVVGVLVLCLELLALLLLSVNRYARAIVLLAVASALLINFAELNLDMKLDFNLKAIGVAVQFTTLRALRTLGFNFA